MAESRRTLGLLLSLLLLSSRALPAAASPDGLTLHAEAVQAAQAGEYVKARVLWEKAYVLHRDPKYLYNLARMAQELDRPDEAAGYFERFVKDATSTDLAELVTRARVHLTELRSGLARLHVVATQSGIDVFVNQRGIGPSPIDVTLWLKPGAHVLSAAGHDRRGKTWTLSLVPGERRTITVDLQPRTQWRVTHQATPPPPRRRMPTWIPSSLFASGLVIAVFSAVPFVLADMAYTEREDATHPDDSAALERKASRYRDVGIGVAVVGGALAVGGLVALIVNRPRPGRVKRKAREWRLVPLGPAGLAAELTF